MPEAGQFGVARGEGKTESGFIDEAQGAGDVAHLPPRRTVIGVVAPELYLLVCDGGFYFSSGLSGSRPG
jgi:hypothetical protein